MHHDLPNVPRKKGRPHLSLVMKICFMLMRKKRQREKVFEMSVFSGHKGNSLKFLVDLEVCN